MHERYAIRIRADNSVASKFNPRQNTTTTKLSDKKRGGQTRGRYITIPLPRLWVSRGAPTPV